MFGHLFPRPFHAVPMMLAPSPVPHRAQQVHAIQKGISLEKASRARKIAARGIAALIAFFISSHLLIFGVGLEVLRGFKILPLF